MKKRTARDIILTVVSIIFYVIAALLMAYAVWTLVKSVGIFNEASEAGQIPENWHFYEITSYYMLGFSQTGCAQYFIYSLLMAAAGLLLQRRPSIVFAVPEDFPDDDDQEADEFFDEAETGDETAIEDFAEPEADIESE